MTPSVKIWRTSVAVMLAVVGGWLGTSVALGYNSALYLQHVHESLALGDVGVGLAKSVMFAILIGLIAADEGLRVERRVSAIGDAATRAVVHCLISVLAADTMVNAVPGASFAFSAPSAGSGVRRTI